MPRIGLEEVVLKSTDDGPEITGGEESGPQRARRVLTDWRERPQGGANLCRHVVELPADLIFGGVRPAGLRKAGGPGGIGGSTQCVRSHMAYGDGLASGSGSGRRGRSLDIARTDAPGKPAANLFGGVQLSRGERPCPGDESPGPAIMWRLSLE